MLLFSKGFSSTCPFMLQVQYYFWYNADTSATTGLDGIVCTGSGFPGTIPDLCVRDLTTRTVFIDVYFALDAATTFFYGTVIRAQYGGPHVLF